MFEFGASDNELPWWKMTRHESSLGCRKLLSEMDKCLTLVHLTSKFRIDLGQSPWGADTSGFSDLVTAWIGCLLLMIGSAPAATGAIAGVDQHWTNWMSMDSVVPPAPRVDSTWAFVEAQRR